MNAREVALQTVRDVFPAPGTGTERGAQEALDYRARKANLDARDRAFATELAYGSIKMRRALDWYLESFIGERKTELPTDDSRNLAPRGLRAGLYARRYTCDRV